jgi:hypothetical protein
MFLLCKDCFSWILRFVCTVNKWNYTKAILIVYGWLFPRPLYYTKEHQRGSFLGMELLMWSNYPLSLPIWYGLHIVYCQWLSLLKNHSADSYKEYSCRFYTIMERYHISRLCGWCCLCIYIFENAQRFIQLGIDIWASINLDKLNICEEVEVWEGKVKVKTSSKTIKNLQRSLESLQSCEWCLQVYCRWSWLKKIFKSGERHGVIVAHRLSGRSRLRILHAVMNWLHFCGDEMWKNGIIVDIMCVE